MDMNDELASLAYGSFTRVGGSGAARCGIRVGDRVLDLSTAPGLPYPELWQAPTLNPLLAAGHRVWAQVHEAVVELAGSAPDDAFIPLAQVRNRLPFDVADYVDFFSSEHHARNTGQIMRPGLEPLTPNWKHMPIGYHGRSGTVVVSGTTLVRPCGQRRPPDAELPVYGPTRRLDIEAEVGFVVGGGTELGTRVGLDGIAEHVFGVVLLNDWSARDVQGWEYQPLGPFLGKSFGTSISAWVTPLSALDAARVAPPPRDLPLLPYLDDAEQPPWGLDLTLAVSLNGHVVSRPRFAAMYWTPAQQLAHLTVNGASLRPGDLFGSGTVSDTESWGSLLELCWGGRDPIAVGEQTRTFLEDGDEVVLTATAPGPGGATVSLGEVRGTIAPALSLQS